VDSFEDGDDLEDPFSEWEDYSEDEIFNRAPKRSGRTVRITQFVPAVFLNFMGRMILRKKLKIG
jgi:hypothetical protein